MNKKYTICYIVCVGMQQWASVNTRNAFGMYGKQLHGKQVDILLSKNQALRVLNYC